MEYKKDSILIGKYSGEIFLITMEGKVRFAVKYFCTGLNKVIESVAENSFAKRNFIKIGEL